MLAVSEAFKREWAHLPKRTGAYQVQIKLRYWNGSAYVLEGSYRTIAQNEIVSISPILWKFSDDYQNDILSSNVTLRLKNSKWKWLPGNNTDGILKPDPTATGGYILDGAEVVIKYGYEVPDGSDVVYATYFTGTVEAPMFDTNAHEAEILVLGGEAALSGADAAQVFTQKTQVALDPASGDGNEVDFEGDPSIYYVEEVRQNAVAKNQGADYSLSQINDADLNVKVTMSVAPDAGHSMDYTGRQWLRNKSVSYLIGELCDEAGIGAGDRSIIEPEYPDVTQYVEVNSQAEWEAATVVNMSTDFADGELWHGRYPTNYDFETGDFTSWTIGSNNSPTDDPTVGGPTGDWGYYAKLLTQSSVGTFNVGAWLSPSAPTFPFSPGGYPHVSLSGSGTSSISTPSDTSNLYRLWFYVEGNAGRYAYIGTNEYFNKQQTITFRYGVSYPIGVGDARVQLAVDDIEGVVIDNTASFESDEIDLLAAPTEWGKLVASHVLNGGTLTYQTNVASASGGPYDGWTNLAGDDTIQSNLKRYLKIRADSTPATGNINAPEIDKVQAYYQSSSLFVAHADFKGRSVLSAIKRLAFLTGSEFGFTNGKQFYFRPKTVAAASVLDLNQSNAIKRLGRFEMGYGKIVNTVGCTYGSYYAEVDSVTEGESSPTSIERFGRRVPRSPLVVNDFLFSNNADFAEALAKIFYTAGYQAKRRTKAYCRIIPHLELADVVSVTFFDSPLQEEAYVGDEQQKEPSFGPTQSLICRDVLFKIVGLETDIMAGTTILDLEEVLT